MGRITVVEFVSLNGVMEAPERWQFPFITPDVAEAIGTQLLGSDALLLGRNTYEAFAREWPQRTQNEFGLADKLNAMPKYVASRTLRQAEWSNTHVLHGALEQEVMALKQRTPGTIYVPGSATLVQELMRHDLIDEYHLMIHPVVLTSGRQLFASEPSEATLKLLDHRAFASGVTLLTYQPAHAS